MSPGHWTIWLELAPKFGVCQPVRTFFCIAHNTNTWGKTIVSGRRVWGAAGASVHGLLPWKITTPIAPRRRWAGKLSSNTYSVCASFRNPLSCSARTEIPSGKCQLFGDTIPCNTTHLRQSGAHQWVSPEKKWQPDLLMVKQQQGEICSRPFGLSVDYDLIFAHNFLIFIAFGIVNFCNFSNFCRWFERR